jgi:cytochrome b
MTVGIALVASLAARTAWGSRGDDDVRLPRDELLRQGRQAIRETLRPPPIDRHVAAVYIPQFAQSVT